MAATVLSLVALGFATGTLLPRLISIIPGRAPSPKIPYRALADVPHLGALLGAVTAAVWLVLGLAIGLTPELPALLFVAVLGVAMAYVDVRTHKLPDWLTYPAFCGAAALLLFAAASTGALGAYTRAWAGALIMVATFLGLTLVRPGDLGLGDVKLAAVVGLLLGWIGWSHIVIGGMLGLILAALYALALILRQRASRHDHVPLGPFLLTGTLGAVVLGATLLPPVS